MSFPWDDWTSDDWMSAIISFLLHELVVITLVPIVLNRRKEPSATVAWIMTILFMPALGAVLFLFFGNDRLERRSNRRSEKKRRLRGKVESLVDHLGSMPSSIDAVSQLQLYRLSTGLTPFEPVAGNHIELLPDIAENYRRQIEAIDAAQHHVHVLYYIVRSDKSGKLFRDAMIRAARRGVKVRFLYDGVGTLGLSYRFLHQLREAGVETASFIPFQIFTRRWVFNFRNHRKIVVVDGKIGFTGGANIGDEYINGIPGLGRWSDLHLRVEGPVVSQMQRIFSEDWAFATNEELLNPELYRNAREAGSTTAQVIAGGPDMDNEVFHELFFGAIINSMERLRIATPYFVPSEAIVMAIVSARRRGVEVQLLVPAASDTRIVAWAGESYYEMLLNVGVEIQQYDGFMHAKYMTVDNRWAVIGSANVDNRSMKLNFEMGLILYDNDLVRDLDRNFEVTLKNCRQIKAADWQKRSFWQNLPGKLSRLFSPVL